MSRIGKEPIVVPAGVDVKLDGQNVTVKGSKGTLDRVVHPTMKLKLDGTTLTVEPVSEKKEFKKFQGLTRSLVNNMVVGVSQGFMKSLTLNGVGYRVAAKGTGVTLTLGYSHPITFDPPEGVALKVVSQTVLEVSGCNKESVGEVAAKIRKFRPPEPYHGKGVRYTNEVIVTKEGKSSSK